MGNEPCQVMVVDDDPVVLNALERLLVLWGYRALPLRRFEEARAFLASASGAVGVGATPGQPSKQPPDALVVDIRLGEYNGLQLVHLARQSNPGIAIIVVSGFDDPVLRDEAARAGAAYLMKPAELTRLKELLPPPVRH